MSIIEKAMEKAQKERAQSQTEPTSAPNRSHPAEQDTFGKSQETVQHSSYIPEEKTQVEQVAQMPPVQATTEKADLPNEKAPTLEQNKQHVAPSEGSALPATDTQDQKDEEQNTTRINPIPELIMATEQALTYGGSYRLLKECIIATRKSHPDRNLFMITSAMRNEGKTITSCNLACALAMEFDTTVLLIDVDLRAPSCHRVLGVTNPPKGLSDCLLHNTPITDCLIHTGIGKLSLLCAGSITEKSAELVTSKRMQDFLAEVKHRYPDRIIILDSLPLLPFAESRALSRMVDGVMLVVRENVTYKRHVETALDQLQDVPLMGMIYNAATAFGAEKDILNYTYYQDKEY